MRGTGTAGDQDVMAANQLRTFITLDFDGMGIDESRVAFERRYIVAAKLRLDHLDLAKHDRLRTKCEVGHRDAIFENIAAAVKGALAKTAQI